MDQNRDGILDENDLMEMYKQTGNNQFLPVLTCSHNCPVKLTHVTELSRPRSGPEEAEGDDQGVGRATQLHPLPQHVRRSPRR